jgi:hypothetical protein
MPDQPLNHIRRPQIPWRSSYVTECGRPVAELKNVISRAEALALIAKHGIKRTAFLLCMTCMTTCDQYPDWHEDPAGALAREFFGAYRDPRLSDELRALEALVAKHREEFDGYLAGLEQATSLDAARRRRARSR